MKKILKIILWVLLAILLLAAAFVGFLSVRDFRPEPVQEAEVLAAGAETKLQPGQSLRLCSWNIGYGGLGEEADFFMDGGSSVMSADRRTVQENLAAMAELLAEEEPALLLLQELDRDSRRSYREDQAGAFLRAESAFAPNYRCDFVPFPWPPMGKVDSGLFTGSDYAVTSSERVALHCPFSWPVSTANLKRCLLLSRLPLEGTEQELVLINLHMDAYDDGEGRALQTEQLWTILEEEYQKGNFVIAGGDFNQSFPGSQEAFPLQLAELWTPGVLDGDLPEGWRYAYDGDTPSCRLLNTPYTGEGHEHYVIDGFLLSPNVELQAVETKDLGFEHSDHNPVFLDVKLACDP